MSNPTTGQAVPRLTLWADCAADLMTPNPISIRESATIKEAVALLTDRGISAVPVIDPGGRPVGVLSQSDIVVHERERTDAAAAVPARYDQTDMERKSTGTPGSGNVDSSQVRDLMTPVVFSVPPERPAVRVVEEMLGLKVHRLFVVDRDGVLVGVISAHDILRHLRS